MSRGRIYTVCAITFVIQLAAAVSFGAAIPMQWQDTSRTIGDSDLHTVAVSPDRPDIVYAGSSNALFVTSDSGGLWDEVLSFRGSEKGINAIAVSPVDHDTVYAGTDDGLYQSNDRGAHWEKTFTGMGVLENSVLTVAVHPQNPDRLHVGTLSGIYFTEDNGKDWTRGQNIFSGAIVLSIAIDPAHPNIIYAATDMGIYKSLNSGAGWKRILERSLHRKDYLIPELLSTLETNYEEYHDVKIKIKEKIKIRSIAVDQSDSTVLYAGTADGLLISRDSGTTWGSASDLGLLGRSIRKIEVSPSDGDHIYAATDRGVFRYSKKLDIWDGFYKGLSSADARSVDAVVSDNDLTVWTATKKGVYKTVPAEGVDGPRFSETDAEEMLTMFTHEPTAGDIIEAAIEYADVHPGKIKKWRTAAGYKALLPDLRFGYDKSRGWQRSDSWYKIKEYERYDDVTKDRDKGWSVSLTWELGDLIWSSDQTSIDNRSKLMVQLRDDILNEVTRLYFERRRLQLDMHTSPPADMRDRMEKELRLQELTAGIDALTGSYLSKKLAQSGSGAYRKGVK